MVVNSIALTNKMIAVGIKPICSVVLGMRDLKVLSTAITAAIPDIAESSATIKKILIWDFLSNPQRARLKLAPLRVALVKSAPRISALEKSSLVRLRPLKERPWRF